MNDDFWCDDTFSGRTPDPWSDSVWVPSGLAFDHITINGATVYENTPNFVGSSWIDAMCDDIEAQMGES